MHILKVLSPLQGSLCKPYRYLDINPSSNTHDLTVTKQRQGFAARRSCSNQGKPPHDPAFLPDLLVAAAACAFSFASFLALSASAASLGLLILWTANFTLLPPSIASNGSFLNLYSQRGTCGQLMGHTLDSDSDWLIGWTQFGNRVLARATTICD